MDYRRLRKNQLHQYFILWLACIVIATSCNVNQDNKTDENIEKTILDLEKKALDYWAQGDPLSLSFNLAEDVTYFDDIGAQTRLDGLEEAKSYFSSLDGKINPHKYELTDTKVQHYDDIAILTLQWNITKLDGEAGTPWKATSVYRQTNGKWQVVHAHWSLIKNQ